MPLEYAQFGTLYLDDIPAALGIKVFPNQAFKLGDTCPTCAIPWVFDGKKYVAIRNVCNNVSWEDLVSLDRGFAVSPTPTTLRIVQIDGKAYNSRLIGGETKDGVVDEWKELITERELTSVPTPTAEDLWHCNGAQFWTGIAAGGQKLNKVVLGGKTEYDITTCPQDTRSSGLGYRPVLEPLPSLDFETAEKRKCYRIYGPDGFVEGWLQGVNDYDVIIKPRFGMGPRFDCVWAKETDKDKVVIDRSAIIWAQHVDARFRKPQKNG